ncbi:RsmD family RNA methyltransferase [Streptomyces enissocaesilis]|uniref:Methyltransferase n=1 Tax=Streptomyces enissocaesilis TaxID=332589 RepID=A0ABP6K7V8_9ACTN
MPADADHSGYFALRDQLLGPLRTTVLTSDQLCEAGRLIYGDPYGLSLLGVPAPEMTANGITLLGRTAIECSVDSCVIPVVDTLAALQAVTAPEGPDTANPLIVDLFCGSGNFGHHLGQRLSRPVHASEFDSTVYNITRKNLDRVKSEVQLHLLDYRDLLDRLPARSTHDTYVVEPPWGPAFTAHGLDLTRTSPPVPEILDDIRRSRNGLLCHIVIKTSDQIAHNSLARSFTRARHLTTITPDPLLPYGTNMNFHLYELNS